MRARRGRRVARRVRAVLPARGAAPWARGLAVAAGAGFVLAALGAVAAPLLKGMIDLWSGFAVLRDGQQYAAPLAVAVAVGFGLGVERVTRGAGGADAAGRALGAFAIAVPLVLLPSLAWGAAGRLEPVHYPGSWARARDIVRADRTAGDVLVLPWATYRSYGWNGRRTSLDALPRYLDRRVITSDAVVIGAKTIPAEDPRSRALDEAIASGRPLTEPLRAAGVRYVAFDSETGPGNPDRARLAGAERLVDDADLVLYRIPGPARVREEAAPLAPTVIAWLVAIGVTLWSFLPQALAWPLAPPAPLDVERPPDAHCDRGRGGRPAGRPRVVRRRAARQRLAERPGHQAALQLRLSVTQPLRGHASRGRVPPTSP
ncbi:hypothetical protein [Actinomadura sp. J1-007]|uniref:hypothetical protein n=1 Tax=Actinomadura sp. J1-007 TaxID=2661913 RepID=UPI001368A604|nr:hypothetical protein [Actinomadura sp. J1-007]